MTTHSTPPHVTVPEWLLVEPPPELWPLVVASTIERTRVRRQVIRSLRVPLAMAAVVLVIMTSAVTVWVVRRISGGVSPGAASGHGVPSREPLLEKRWLNPGRPPGVPHGPRAPTAPHPRR